ncbi:MAG TPA: hypothetical protein VME43_17665 [Bryobacteraceae bacterium]|nr:hypothetical protein [Bryobacteraceae bacterium]
MSSNFIPFVVLWTLMAAVVLAMVVWRKMVASHEDDQIHVLDGASEATSQHQVQLANKLDQIDKWGKTLTVITIVFGVVLAAAYIYSGWVNAAKIVE